MRKCDAVGKPIQQFSSKNLFTVPAEVQIMSPFCQRSAPTLAYTSLLKLQPGGYLA